jgi:phosphoribosyl-ATP pyrophosphohydrolase/phosphoribosyl-AMP cyclohydrolase/histidinol dehydrogenase
MERAALRRIAFADIPEAGRRARDPGAEEEAARIIEEVKAGGLEAVREWALRLGDLEEGRPLLIDRAGLLDALDAIGKEERGLLERARDRILAFARAQRSCLSDLSLAVPGGRAGHEFIPVGRAGCYVPGGRFPLPSSALMTLCAAGAAGVPELYCAGPRPAPLSLAAAALCGASGFLAAGGAQGIAALAFGVGLPACDVIVGPGGRHAAAAKRLLAGTVGTEAPAGPSELLVLCGPGADPRVAAADLLAQAEHDSDAIPALVTCEEEFALAVDAALANGLSSLPEPNRRAATASLAGGWCLVATSREEARAAVERFAPEHLEVLGEDARSLAAGLRNAGALFLGSASAEVMGDYGAGPNHCLPTGGAARFAAGLSVLSFLRARTWLELEDGAELAADAAALARLEGLEAHARAAEMRG